MSGVDLVAALGREAVEEFLVAVGGSKAEMDALVEPEGNRTPRTACKNCGSPGPSEHDGLCAACADNGTDRNHRTRQDSRRHSSRAQEVTRRIALRVRADNPDVAPEHAWRLAVRVVSEFPALVFTAEGYNPLNYYPQHPEPVPFRMGPEAPPEPERRRDSDEPEGQQHRPDPSPRTNDDLDEYGLPHSTRINLEDHPRYQQPEPPMIDLNVYDARPSQPQHVRA